MYEKDIVDIVFDEQAIKQYLKLNYRPNVESIWFPSAAGRWYMREAMAFLKTLDNWRNIKILDAGCGIGISSLYFLSEGFTGYSGEDVSEDRVKLGNDLLKHLGSPPLITVNNIRSIKGSYEAVVMLDFLYRFEERILIEIFSKLQSKWLLFTLFDYQGAKKKRNYYTFDETKEILRKSGWSLRSTLTRRQAKSSYSLHIARKQGV